MGPDRRLIRLTTTIAAAFVAETVFKQVGQAGWFVLVFATVYAAENLPALLKKDSPAYLEDILYGVAFYLASGLFAYYVDVHISVYTGKHAGPAVPALVVALLDRTFSGKTPDSGWR